jgi:hypothetical protein
MEIGDINCLHLPQFHLWIEGFLRYCKSSFILFYSDYEVQLIHFSDVFSIHNDFIIVCLQFRKLSMQVFVHGCKLFHKVVQTVH